MLRLQHADRLLLCTDGLTEMVEDNSIVEVLSRSESPTVACQSLLERALQAGGKDNVTVVVADYSLPIDTTTSHWRGLSARTCAEGAERPRRVYTHVEMPDRVAAIGVLSGPRPANNHHGGCSQRASAWWGVYGEVEHGSSLARLRSPPATIDDFQANERTQRARRIKILSRHPTEVVWVVKALDRVV